MNFIAIWWQVASVITMWTRLQPDYASNMWNEALNKRLGTEVIKVSSPFHSFQEFNRRWILGIV